MKIGIAQIPLNPPLGLPMAGYIMRKGVSRGVIDPLYVQVLFLQDDNKSLAIAVADLLGIPDDLSMNGADLIVPVATHTHAGPAIEEVKDLLLSTTKEALDRAKRDAAKVETVELMRFSVQGICAHRDIPKSEPLEATLIVWRRVRSTPVGLLIFPCHPTVLGPENLFYSADLAGGIRRQLSERLGMPVVFVNSCAGNISTHYTRGERSVQEIERLAEKFVQKVPVSGGVTIECRPFRWRSAHLELPVIPRGDNVRPQDKRAQPGIQLSRLRKDVLKHYRVSPLVLVKLGQLHLLFLPFEVFYEACQRLRLIIGSDYSAIICYALAYRPYLVPPWAKGSYEWFASVYGDDAEERLTTIVQRLAVV
jgi:hypothetical protein